MLANTERETIESRCEIEIVPIRCTIGGIQMNL